MDFSAGKYGATDVVMQSVNGGPAKRDGGDSRPIKQRKREATTEFRDIGEIQSSNSTGPVKSSKATTEVIVL